MTNLSPAECNAGISRKALETLKTKDRIVSDGAQEVQVIQTVYRRLSILLTRDSGIVLRDACFVGQKCDVNLIHVDQAEAYTLGRRLMELSDEAPPAEKKNGAGADPEPWRKRKPTQARP